MALSTTGMSVLADGVYAITNVSCHNNAALLKDDLQESVRGIFPLSASTFRDEEKVKCTTMSGVLELIYLPT